MNSCEASIEQKYKQSAVSAVLGTRTSKSQFNKIRMIEGFQQASGEQSTEAVQRSHVPAIENIVIGNHDEQTLLAEVQALPSEQLNWSELARKYDVRNVNSDDGLKNGGQVIKEFLRSKDVDVDRFGTQSIRLRRKRKRGPGGEITIPITASIAEINQEIKKRIEDGTYNIGELITPKEFSRLTLTKDGTFSTEPFFIEGRKIPLLDIRQKMLDNQETQKLIRASEVDFDTLPMESVNEQLCLLSEVDESLDNDDKRQRLKEIQTTRYLTCWADHSTIAGHTYVLYTIGCLYDAAVFFTQDELNQNGIDIDIEETLSKPLIHIIARCGSSDEDTVVYAEERRKCIQTLPTPVTTSTGIQFYDILRFFTGDMPALAAESGQQYGGNFPCSNCGSPAVMFDDFAFSLRQPLNSLSNRVDLLFKGRYGSYSVCRPFAALTTAQLAHELAVRGINSLGKKDELKRRLQQELGGVQRVPTLLYGAESESMENLGLNQYEITLSEPLHDYSNHIKNLLNEIPAHLSKEGKAAFESAIQAIFKDKQTIRGCDYRDAAVVLPQILQSSPLIPQQIIKLLNSLCEIGRLLYSRESQRTNQSVLRLHLVVWTHWVQLREIFSTTKSITKRKLWGYYAHALLTHAPILYRVISPRQLNTENEERMFGTLKDITKRNSSRRAGEIEYNALIRLEEESRHNQCSHTTHDKVINKHSANTQQKNTTVSQQTIHKYSHHWQALLEKIPDYLILGEGKWWTNLPSGDIEFFDTQFPNPGSPLHQPALLHFRSTNSNDILAYLTEKWKECLESNKSLPLTTLHDYDLEKMRSSIVTLDESEDAEDTVLSVTILTNETEEQQPTLEDFNNETEEQQPTLEDFNNETEEIQPTLEDFNNETEEQQSTLESPQHNEAGKNVLETLISLPITPSSTSRSMAEDGSTYDTHNSVHGPQTPRRKIKKLLTNRNSILTPPHTPAERCKCKTKLGAALMKLFGDNDKDTIALDKAKHASKQRLSSKILRTKFQELETKISTKVLQLYTKCNKEIHEWEKDFISEKSRFPTKSDIYENEPISTRYRQRNIAKELLQSWNISIHK